MNNLNLLHKQDIFRLGKKKLRSRLILGTGKYPSLEIMQKCHEIAETEMITVALRRVTLNNKKSKNILDHINLDKIFLLPNTAGAHSAEEALKLTHIASSMDLDLIKIEVMGDSRTLLPDPVETARAVELIRKNYSSDKMYLMVYTSDDPVLARRLYNIGADCIMPAGSPIGSGRGIQNHPNMLMILEILQNKVPLILDAGIGSPSDVVVALEMGFDAVLLNSAVAQAKEPIKMACAMKYACIAGRLTFLSGRMPRKLYGVASSPGVDFY